jgi:hypothetical protein
MLLASVNMQLKCGPCQGGNRRIFVPVTRNIRELTRCLVTGSFGLVKRQWIGLWLGRVIPAGLGIEAGAQEQDCEATPAVVNPAPHGKRSRQASRQSGAARRSTPYN